MSRWVLRSALVVLAAFIALVVFFAVYPAVTGLIEQRLLFIPLTESDLVGRIFAIAFSIFVGWAFTFGWQQRNQFAGAILILSTIVLIVSLSYFLIETRHSQSLVNNLTDNTPAPTAFLQDYVNPWIPLLGLVVSTIGTFTSVTLSLMALRTKRA